MKSRENEFGVDFEERLKQLRAEIDMLPQEDRLGLRRFADQIEQQQCDIVADCAATCELADNLNLGIASAMFGLWACRCDAERICRRVCGESV
jgi:hypothetical protein